MTHEEMMREGARKILDEYDSPPEGGALVPRGWVEEQMLIPHDQALHIAPEYAQVFADLGYGHLLHACPEGAHGDKEAAS